MNLKIFSKILIVKGSANKMSDYNEFAEEYARQTEMLEGRTRKTFYSLLPPLSGKKVLDVGCGSGHDAEYYFNQGAIVSGIDIAEREIEMAKRRNVGSFTLGNMNNLPFQDNTFDLITSFYALQSSSDVKQSLLEVVRVAKANSQIFILAAHPFRNCLEGFVNDGDGDYYAKRNITTHILDKSITLNEPRHTLMDYLPPEVLTKAELQRIEEHSDFPSSDQVFPGLIYPTYMILQFRKK